MTEKNNKWKMKTEMKRIRDNRTVKNEAREAK